MTEPDRSHAVAIVGMAGRFPGARRLDDFWRNIRDGVESLESFTDADLDAAHVDPAVSALAGYVRKGTVLDAVDQFDATFFGFSPREAQCLDPQQRIFLECAWEAVEHAGYAGSVAGQSVGVYAGVGMNMYVFTQLLANPAFLASVGGYQLMIGNDKDFLSTRVSYKLDLRGPSVSVQTACSTSLVAVAMACRALQRGECDMALAGGVSIALPQRAGYLFEEGMIFSPDGHCRPFDAKAQGTRSGSGAGIVVLKRLADAVADRDAIHAVILGSAMNNDGAAKAGYTAPSIDGQVEVIATAQALAGVEPRSIGYIEAHGTATPLGDPIEVAALTQAFRASTTDTGFCRIGSLKANLGHLDAAAGVAGLIKVVLALKNRELPPLVNFQNANPQLALETSPFVASASAAPWPSARGVPRRAGVSSFGIGGTNAHVVLEEAPATAATEATREAHLLVLSARTPTALDRATEALAGHLRAHPEISLADVEYTLQVGRESFPHRRVVVVRDHAHAVAALAEPKGVLFLGGTYQGGVRPVAFLFSGQGSQHARMGSELYRTERAYREAVDRCAAALEPHLGIDLRRVLAQSDEESSINETRLTQPALFTVEYALASLWMSRGIAPSAMLGHSIGEYVAAHLAGVMTLDDALAVVAARGRLMQAVPPGSMAAVRLPALELAGLLGPSSRVEIAAVNAPDLCTVSGPSDAIAEFGKRVEANGIDFRPLHTSHAFHSAMMEPALAPFEELLARTTLSPPRIPYVSNVTGTWITDEQATSPEYYARHVRQAVQFESGVRTVAADPATLLLEVGPGNALTSLARLTLGKDAGKRVFASLSHVKERRSDIETTLETAGRLWLAGAQVNWADFHTDSRPHRVPLPTYPFERKRHWVDAQLAAFAEQPTSRPRQSDSVGDWLFAPTWTRDDAPTAIPHLDGCWLVLAPDGPFGVAVARRVAAAGATAIIAAPGSSFRRRDPSHFSVRPEVGDDIAEVVRDIRARGNTIAGVLHLWNIAPGNGGAELALSYHSLVGLAAALEPSPDAASIRVIVATSGAESVLDEPVRTPERAIVRGPVLSLPTEVPGLRMRSVDLQLTDGDAGIEITARELIDEAANRDGENMVARRAGRRWVRRFERVALPLSDTSTLPLKPHGVYLITGGLGGIGVSLAKWLATRTSARLLLTARSLMPAPAEWDAWLATHAADDRTSVSIRAVREIEQAGGEVLVAAADAADPVAMKNAIELARTRWGSIDGVVHAAGIAGNGRIAYLKDSADVAAVLAPKVSGLTVLVELLGEVPLDFVVLLSSINSFLGAPGLADYASANAVLDAFVDSAGRPAGWRHVASLNYGPWRDVGMASRLFEGGDGGKRGRNDGFKQLSISPAAGTEAFGRVLASGRGHVIVIPQDLSHVMELVRAHAAGSSTAALPGAAERAEDSPSATASAEDRPAVSTTYEPPASDTERRLAEIWCELLGVDRIGMQDDFFELGGHSLLATRVLSRIDQALGVRLTLRDIFDAPTVRGLADKVAATERTHSRSSSATGDDREEMEF